VNRSVALAAAAGTALALALAAFALLPPSHPAKPGLGRAPAYVLTDQHGHPFSSWSLRGQVQVVAFLFPYCTTYCPLTARNLLLTQRRLTPDLRRRTTFVLFNVDPSGAAPPRLSAFLTQEGIPPTDPRWHYLTGSPTQIRRVVTTGFHVFYRKVPEPTTPPQPDHPNPLASRAAVDYDIVHNDTIAIVSPTGTITTYFPQASTVPPPHLAQAVRTALP